MDTYAGFLGPHDNAMFNEHITFDIIGHKNSTDHIRVTVYHQGHFFALLMA